MAIDNLVSGSVDQHRGAVRYERLHVRRARCQQLHLGARGSRRGDAPRQPGEPGRLRAHPDQDPQGRWPGHAQRPGPRTREGCQVLPRVDLRGVRRPARASPARGLLGQRQPDRHPRGVRRGQALRRGDDHGVPPPARPRRAHRSDLQHLRNSDETRRRAGGVELPRAGAARRTDHDLRRRLTDPLVHLRQRRDPRVPRTARLRRGHPHQHRQRQRVHHPPARRAGDRGHGVEIGDRPPPAAGR